MDDTDLRLKVAMLEAQSKPTEKEKAIDKIPGGSAGALVLLAIVAFFAQDSFEESKREKAKMTESLIRVESNQKLLAENFNRVALDVQSLEKKSEDRYTGDDANTRARIVDSRITKVEAKLDVRSGWMNEIDARLQKIEIESKSKLKGIKNASEQSD